MEDKQTQQALEALGKVFGTAATAVVEFLSKIIIDAVLASPRLAEHIKETITELSIIETRESLPVIETPPTIVPAEPVVAEVKKTSSRKVSAKDKLTSLSAFDQKTEEEPTSGTK